MEGLASTSLRPFPAVSVEETLPSWRKSIAQAAAQTPLIEVLVSRHFCLLGAGDPERAEFVRDETARREPMEKVLPFFVTELDRWTSALGFCDLLSLYLCCGSQEPVEFPLAHPASPRATQAPKVTLQWRNGSPSFSHAVFKPGAQVSTTVRTYNGSGSTTSPQTFSWTFAADNRSAAAQFNS